MGYVGNQTTNAYSSMDKQTITGNGGASYTLTHAVANAQEIEVFVNNVRQEAGVAYTVNGTALNMTGNVASTDDFYVIYQGKALQTVVPPDGSVSTAKLANGAVTSAKLAGLTSSDMPAGTVLQVKQTVKSDKFTTSSNSFVDITGLSVSITPSSVSSKILVDVHIGMADATGDSILLYQLVRDSTPIGIGDSGNGTQATMGHTVSGDRGNSVSMRYLDSPSTTSAITYKLQGLTKNTQTMQINHRDTDCLTISTITVTEIAG